MFEAANFFDPNSNGFDITDIATILFFTVALVGAVAGLLRFTANAIKRVVREELEHYTRPIQPGYRNGGQSLADVAAKVDKLIEKLENKD